MEAISDGQNRAIGWNRKKMPVVRERILGRIRMGIQENGQTDGIHQILLLLGMHQEAGKRRRRKAVWIYGERRA
jgi:hypothetical protein